MGVITFNEYKGSKKTSDEIVKEVKEVIEKVIDKEPITESLHEPEPEIQETATTIVEEFSGYKLYRDKQENFCCEVAIDGASMDNSSVRLIIESPEWNLLFNGKIEKNGKCTIPIKKLPILSEGTCGKIKLEVIAEDTVFVPWEEDFCVKNSKKVTVKVLEQEKNDKPSVKVTRI